MRLSIVIPFLNEADNIPRLHERLCAVARRLEGDEVEIVLVDDGSTDGSIDAIRALPAAGPTLRVVRLSRNFGSHAAIAAGVSHATGDVLTFLSADLQDPPELLLDMLARWREGHEIVWATRVSRKDPLSTRLFARAYYTLMRRYALPQMPIGGVDLCMVDRRVVQSLGNLQERNSNVFCLLMWAGYTQCVIPYHREERRSGRSKWSVAKKIKLFIDSFVAFSFLPMRLISALGGALSVAGLAYAAYIVTRALFYGSAVHGWASLMVVLLLCSGVQLLMLGILSEYLWRSLDASRNRPVYIVRESEVITGGAAAAAVDVDGAGEAGRATDARA
ncbi:MAG: glycosyltransferase family 2 protein [Chthonomonadales bacterium]|nr:glycosyltransferase family 2 protein [Chthonomonadales bacterium]